MFFTQKKTAAAKPARKLHSVHALLDGRVFSGKIESGQLSYAFSFVPHTAANANGKLELTGRFSVRGPAGKTAEAQNVKAVLRGTQGAIGTSTKPASFNFTAASAFQADAQGTGLLTEYTDSRSAVGVLYFALSPLDGKTLGVPYDMNAVQLNGRLTVTSQTARDLQWLFNQAAAALENKNAVTLAEPYITAIDQILRA